MTKPPPFRRVLIANRGEIAVRILRTLHDLGIEGVVVHHAVDAASPAVRLADRAIEITGRTPVAAYLDAEQIVAAATARRRRGHSSGLRLPVRERRLRPRRSKRPASPSSDRRADAIELMGDKVRARAFVAKHGFPVAPSAIEDDDPTTFVAARARGRLPAADQAVGRRRRQGHAHRARSGRARRRDRPRPQRRRALLRRRPALRRALCRAARATSRCRCWAMRTAMSCICSSANARCSGASRRSSRRRPRRRSIDAAAQARSARPRPASPAAASYRNAGTVEFIYGAAASSISSR